MFHSLEPFAALWMHWWLPVFHRQKKHKEKDLSLSLYICIISTVYSISITLFIPECCYETLVSFLFFFLYNQRISISPPFSFSSYRTISNFPIWYDGITLHVIYLLWIDVKWHWRETCRMSFSSTSEDSFPSTWISSHRIWYLIILNCRNFLAEVESSEFSLTSLRVYNRDFKSCWHFSLCALLLCLYISLYWVAHAPRLLYLVCVKVNVW